jgi:hypothetical protein
MCPRVVKAMGSHEFILIPSNMPFKLSALTHNKAKVKCGKWTAGADLFDLTPWRLDLDHVVHWDDTKAQWNPGRESDNNHPWNCR